LFEGPTVTIPRRTDQPYGDNPRVHRQNVLADLPHLGDAVVPPRPEPAARKKKSSHPAFAEMTEEFEQEPARIADKRKKRRYADQAHAESEEWQPPRRKQLAERSQRPQRQPAKQKQREQSNPRNNRAKQKAPVGSFLVVLKEQAAPFAGFVTTAALVAAAGLMFMIMNNRQPPIANVDEFALPSFRVEKNELEQIATEDTPPLVDTDITPDGLEPTADDTSDIETTPTDTSAVVVEPVIEQIVESTAPLGTLSFPVTSSPLALDYSKAAGTPDPDLQALPVVAERPETQGTEPINR
jgi:hypothetical protein